MSSQAILAQHSSTCRACQGRIFAGEPIVRVEQESDSPCAGLWVHEECAPEPEEGAER